MMRVETNKPQEHNTRRPRCIVYTQLHQRDSHSSRGRPRQRWCVVLDDRPSCCLEEEAFLISSRTQLSSGLLRAYSAHVAQGERVDKQRYRQ